MSLNPTRRFSAVGGAGHGADDWVERVRAATDIVDLIGQTVPLRRSGRNFMGRCPFHEEKSPSFSVNAKEQFYHCFGCKVGGDVFKFVMATENLEFIEAVKLLSQRAGIPIPERRVSTSGPKAQLHEALDAAASAYEQWLADPSTGAAARAYLEQRGITRETQRQFRLGLSLPGWENLVPRLRARFSEEVLIEARLAGRKEGSRGAFDWFRNRLMVPLIANGGAVIGFGARAMGDEQPKYLNSPESTVYHKSQFLFGLEQARRTVKAEGEMIVVEGYFDVIALHQAGITNVVAASGTALTPDHARTLKRMVRGVALTFDGDRAGQNAMLRSLGVLLAAGLDVVVVDLPAGDDPDSLVRRAGAEGWCRVRDSACDAVEFVHRHMLRTVTAGDPRERALQAIVPLIAGVTETIRRHLLIERASQVFGLPEQVVRKAVEGASRSATSSAPVAPAVSRPTGPLVVDKLERDLLQGLWHVPERLDDVRGEVPTSWFEDGQARALAELWWDLGVMIPEEDDASVSLARELASAQVGQGWDASAEVTGAVRLMKVRRLKHEMRERHARLRGASGEQAIALLQEIQDLAQALQRWSQ